MSMLFTDSQSFNMNLEYFNPQQQFDGHISASHPPSFEEKIAFNSSQNLAATTTPPQKRRRGRPPKCPSSSDSQPSPAAHLSAAVVKQGTPKASAPLMRISPLRGKKSENQSSPVHKTINPSPKGGFLMTLDSDHDKPVVKKIKRSSSTSSANSIYSMTLSANKARKSNHSVTVNNFMTPPEISLATQESIQSLTTDSSHNRVVKTSVNPSLLLSSPMPNTHGFNNNKKRQNENKKITKKAANKLKSNAQHNLVSSSPATPNSLASSCFSSIIQSSPLYHGYYANISSPSNTLSSSPIKFQMKPIELPELKKEVDNKDVFLPKIDELPKNPMNSPTLKPREPSFKLSTTPTKGEFQLSFAIDEQGQAQIIKKKTAVKPNALTSPLSRPKFTRHESLMNISQNSYHLGRSSSLSNIHQRKAQPSISSVLEEHSSQDYNEMFIEPLKMSSDPLLSDYNQNVDLETLQNSESSSLMEDEEDLEDESMNFDARKALIKMIRRSL